VLRERLLPPGRAGTWRTLWADQDADRLPSALDDLSAPSLFGGVPVLVVRHADTLREEDQASILDMLPRLDGSGSLLLVARAADQRRKLFAACLRGGAGFGFPPLEPRAVPPWVVRLARERGHEIAPAAVEELVERCGADLGVVAGEVEKLSLVAGPKARIEPAHVRAVVAAVRSHQVQELTDRLARKDVAGAARVLRLLLAEGEPPIRLLSFLAANFRRSLHVAELAEQGVTPDEIGRRLGMPSWLVGRSLGRGRASDLVRALLVLRRLDVELKTSRGAEVFDAALLEIAGSAAAR